MESFINPQFGLGVGAIVIQTKIKQNDDPLVENTAVAAVVTGSTQVRLVEFSTDRFQISLEGSVRVFAGMAFGMVGEAALRFAFKRF